MATIDDLVDKWDSTDQTLDSPVSHSLDTLNKVNKTVPILGG